MRPDDGLVGARAPESRAGGYHDPPSHAPGNIAGRRAHRPRGTGCGRIAVWAAPEKTASAERTPAAVEADKVFWATLHGGAYDRIPAALTALKAAYLAEPNDAVTASHIGWMHIWRLGERARHGPVRPEITDDAVLARKYFEEAVRLDPREARYLGFYASLLMAEGTIHKDEKMVRRGSSP